jgi:hypothetical protein
MRWWEHGDPNVVLTKQSKAGEPMKFLLSIPIEGEGCILWPYAKNNMGYAQYSINDGGRRLASRFSCERRNGPPPTLSHQAAHACGNGHLGCVAPWHLSWKEPAANIADKKIHGTLRHGAKHPSSRVTEEQVKEIRRLAGSISQREIGQRFGIGQSAVSLIIRRVNWASLA